jgi:hypothetical protein
LGFINRGQHGVNRAQIQANGATRPGLPFRAGKIRFPQPFLRFVRDNFISVRRFPHPCARFPLRAAISQSVRAISRSVRAIFPSVRRFSRLCGHFSIRAGKNPCFRRFLVRCSSRRESALIFPGLE